MSRSMFRGPLVDELRPAERALDVLQLVQEGQGLEIRLHLRAGRLAAMATEVAGRGADELRRPR